MCGDFEHGTTVYVNGAASDVPLGGSNVTASVEAPGSNGGHALYIDSTGGTYHLEGSGMVPTSQIAATFDLELTLTDPMTPATGLAVLDFDMVPGGCYVALDYQPSPPRLALAQNCGSMQPDDLVMPLPSHTQFATVAFTVDLVAKTGTVQLGQNMALVHIIPGASTGIPSVILGFFDSLAGTTARVGFDNILVTSAN
jgi:hypothetical protein